MENSPCYGTAPVDIMSRIHAAVDQYAAEIRAAHIAKLEINLGEGHIVVKLREYQKRAEYSPFLQQLMITFTVTLTPLTTCAII